MIHASAVAVSSPPANMTSRSARTASDAHVPSPIPLERTVARRPGSATTRVPPNALLMLLEGRAPIEFFSLFAALPWLTRLPRGDGHPVMVFPGMAASDITTVPLRRYLAEPRLRHPGLGAGPQLRPATRRASSAAPTTCARSPTGTASRSA